MYIYIYIYICMYIYMCVSTYIYISPSVRATRSHEDARQALVLSAR